jgi:hypothetical protein
MSSDPDSLPIAVTLSKIHASGGALILPDLLGPDAVAELEAESRFARAAGQRNELEVSDGAEGRGGNPARALRSAHGGDVQRRLFGAPSLVSALERSCGLTVNPTGGGTYSYYEYPGDFLALHRDIVTCDLTVITCLNETGGATRGGLLVYPRHINDPLSKVRAAGRTAATPVTICYGVSAALLGGVVPHEVTGMEPGQERIVSVMCYRVLLAGNPPS